MAPTSNHPYMLKPSKSTAVIVVDTISSGTDYLKNLIPNINPQKLLPLAAFAATLGLGTAAYYLGKSSRDDDTPSPVKKKSKSLKGRKQKSNRVVFQSPLEKDPQNNGDYVEEEDFGEGEATGAQAPPDDARVDEQLIQKNDVSSAIPLYQAQNNVLILRQCPRGRKTPCIAPFPLKLETFLRVHQIKYELDFNGYEPRMHGSPWITFNTEDITDSQNVLEFLIDKYNLKAERSLTPEQRSMAIAYTHLLENHLYWGIALWRWVYDGARSIKDIQLLPKKTQDLIPDVCRTVEQAAWFHGIGKMTPADVKRAVLQDLRSLSEFLGNKDYFLNTPKPTELDCTAFGMLAQFLWNMQGPFHEAIVSHYKNLRDFCWRIRLNFWQDWENCLNNTDFYTDEPYPVADSINYPF